MLVDWLGGSLVGWLVGWLYHGEGRESLMYGSGGEGGVVCCISIDQQWAI